jgi:hypothetical protein
MLAAEQDLPTPDGRNAEGLPAGEGSNSENLPAGEKEVMQRTCQLEREDLLRAKQELQARKILLEVTEGWLRVPAAGKQNMFCERSQRLC